MSSTTSTDSRFRLTIALTTMALIGCGSTYEPAAGVGAGVGTQDGGGLLDGRAASDTSPVVDTVGQQDVNVAKDTAVAGDVASPTSALVDPACIDVQYQEVLPTGKQDISDLVSGYTPAGYMSFINTALERRYPLGKMLVTDAIDRAPQHCVDTFLPASFRSSASQVLSRMGVIVHECGHFYDIYKKGKAFGASHYQITEGLGFTCTGAANQGAKSTFARSLINTDKWASANKPCAKLGDQGCDSYAAIYLNGDPNDGKFESGDQGFNMLFEEVVQYVNSLAEAVAFKDQIFGATSARDGILTFVWYMTRYLQMARLQYPDSYEILSQNKCWREAILTVWGRAWLYLEATKGDKKLTIKGDKLLVNATEPDLVNEIALLRKIQGCP
ncbi:MAG TPA: hypothetical protein DCQ06_12565 [Myxococcales bacterium]|nr:hypothetical protein [Myxococcales bacterium]